MKKTALVAALATVFATGAAADGHGGWGQGYAYGGGKAKTTTYAPSGPRIVISCYRGPYRHKVKWDKPNPVFINSLIAAGYDKATAKQIAWSVCRNPAYIDNLGSADLSPGAASDYSGGYTGGHSGY